LEVRNEAVKAWLPMGWPKERAPEVSSEEGSRISRAWRRKRALWAERVGEVVPVMEVRSLVLVRLRRMSWGLLRRSNSEM
jgi:hypothetical protein